MTNVPTDGEFGADRSARKPYAGTTGRGGSDASRATKSREDAGATTGMRQQRVLSLVSNAGAFGLTIRELCTETGWHHGQASGALSVLHKAGDLARLAGSTRTGQSIYVLPTNVEDRAVAAFGGKDAGLTEHERQFVVSWETYVEAIGIDGEDEANMVDLDTVKTMLAIIRRLTS